jgi:hypothetical protein
MKISRFGGVALCVAVIAGSTAMAAVVRTTVPVLFPGVDVDGNIDESLGADGVARVTYNDRTGRLRVTGRAVVTNDSNRTHVYANIDSGILDQVGVVDGDIVRDRYRVTARGRASYTAVVRNSTGVEVL